MDIRELYQSKLRTAEEAVRLVKSGDWVDYSQCLSFPTALDRALAGRREELRDVKLRHAISMRPVQVVEQDPTGESFTYNVWHCSGLDRKYLDAGRAYFSPMLFRHCGSYYARGYAPVNVAMVTVAPMDSHGYFSYGLTNCAQQELIDAADTVIVEVNPNMPYIVGLEADSIHVSQVDAIVESSEEFVYPAPVKVNDIDRQIAANIFPYLEDGITLQLGIGGMPNALGSLIAESDLKDLGMHTELMSDGYLTLYRAGKITNAKKELNRGKGIFGICNGSRALYDFLDHRILGRINCQTSGVDQIVCMCISKAGLFLQIFDQIIDQGINKVGIQRVAVRCGIFRNACINIFRHCFIIFTLCDMTVLT